MESFVSAYPLAAELLAELRRLGEVRLNGRGGLSVDVEPEVLAAFMARHGALYRGLRALVIELVEQEQPEQPAAPQCEEPTPTTLYTAAVADLDVDAAVATSPKSPPPPQPEKPPRPGKPGPRTDSGIPYLDGVALAWRARRDWARQHNLPFDEPPPYYWDE